MGRLDRARGEHQPQADEGEEQRGKALQPEVMSYVERHG